jgi:hypothetical protein
MSTGAIAWACLMWTVHQGPAREDFINARGFQIPISYEAKRREEIVELTLFVSRDRGQSWQVVGKKKPTEESFIYRAAEDGTYWFILQEEDHGHRFTPSDLMRARPNQSIVVDTVPPKIQMRAERLENGDVLAHWNVTEEHPDPRSLRLEYQTGARRPDQWTPLPLDPDAGLIEHRFNPGGTGEVRVRVRMKDRAGNQGVGDAVVAAANATPDGGANGPSFSVIPTIRNEQTNPPNLLTSRQSTNATDNSAAPKRPSAGDTPAPLMTPVEPGAIGGTERTSVATSSERTPVASEARPESPRGGLPPVRIVNKREVKLEFEVAKVGPSGLGGADAYVTVNDGATWARWGMELPVTLPSPLDLHGSSPVRGSVTLTLPREGIAYGFIVAVKSKAGLARPAPKPGEPPQIRIELDATAPKAQLFGPMPDPNQRDALLLSWTAIDRNLPSNPVTLEWAERKEGPWNVIGEQLANSGQHSWRLPENVPSRVYLKLTVRDTAGNLAVAQTDKPVLIDLSVPETNIIGVAPLSK